MLKKYQLLTITCMLIINMKWFCWVININWEDVFHMKIQRNVSSVFASFCVCMHFYIVYHDNNVAAAKWFIERYHYWYLVVLIWLYSNSCSETLKTRSLIHRAQSFKVEPVTDRYESPFKIHVESNLSFEISLFKGHLHSGDTKFGP